MVMTETLPYPLILPLTDAAREMGMDEATLRDMVKLGKIRAFVDPEGVMYVQMTQQGTLPVAVAEDTRQPPDDDINARLRQIRRENFAHLEGQPITVSEAARKYGVLSQTIHAWVKQGIVRVLDPGKGRGSRKTLDESDVAYLAKIHQIRKEYGVRSGTPLLDPNGAPNLIKHPTLSQYRHQRN